MNSSLSLPVLKLPRAVEGDPRHSAIEALLQADRQPLWEKSTVTIAHIPLGKGLQSYLKALFHRKQLERGLENIDTLLTREKKGISALHEKLGTPASLRISRVLLIAQDGSQRFYRACEKLLLHNSERLIILQINEPSSRLSEIFLGTLEKPLKALLVSDRDAVSGVLFSLLEDSLKKQEPTQD
jgi:hypothetical protein